MIVARGWSYRSFRSTESVAYVVRVLRHCSHNGFPVVRGWPGDSEEDDMEDDTDVPRREAGEGGARGTASREGPLEGVILRSQLMVLLANRVRSIFFFLVCILVSKGVMRDISLQPFTTMIVLISRQLVIFVNLVQHLIYSTCQ